MIESFPGSRLKLLYLITVTIIVGYGCLFPYTYISDLVRFEKTASGDS